ncbi:hypothetical protein [Desulfurobacterium crinifex]
MADLTELLLEVKDNTSQLLERWTTQSDKWDQQVNDLVNYGKSKIDGFIAGARGEFVGTQLIGASWNENTIVATSYGSSGTIAITTGCILKHDTNPNDDGTPTQSDLYDANGNHLLTVDLHPMADYKTAVYKAVKVHIESQDTEREFHIQVDVINKNPRTRSKNCSSQGQIWIWFSRDVFLDLGFVVVPEYLGTTLLVDGSETGNSNLHLAKGWHLLQSIGKDVGSIIAWDRIDLLRFSFGTDDPLTPVEIILTHPSCLANTALSAILEKAT